MGKRQKEWAKTARLNLLLKLGMVCNKCGKEDDLEFDCIDPQGNLHHTFDTSQRMSFYRQQDRQGNIQVLCHDCNVAKSFADAKKIQERELFHPF